MCIRSGAHLDCVRGHAVKTCSQPTGLPFCFLLVRLEQRRQRLWVPDSILTQNHFAHFIFSCSLLYLLAQPDLPLCSGLQNTCTPCTASLLPVLSVIFFSLRMPSLFFLRPLCEVCPGTNVHHKFPVISGQALATLAICCVLCTLYTPLTSVSELQTA